MDSPLSAPGSSRSTPTAPETEEEEEIPVQPAFFYPSGHNHNHHHGDVDDPDAYLSPDQDPFATRGIPVFKPTYDEFRDFEKYMGRVEVWGRKSGIVKVIPPKEWSDALPPVNPLLPALKLKNPIEQHMLGQSGLFRQNNVEKRRRLTLKDWVELCSEDGRRAPTIKDGEVKTRGTARSAVRSPRKPRKAKKTKAEADEEDTNERDQSEDRPTANERPSEAAADDLPTPDADHNPSGETAPANPQGPAFRERPPDDPFYTDFNPRAAWLPDETRAEDYTPEACRELERIFWRTCGIGIPAQYGADMAGSLFTNDTTEWNVAKLPSFLSRLCLNKDLPGVNTPYLYYGMWRATFAWHVEDMDLYSINYIHWGAPKYWYAIPNERSKAFEVLMKGFFPGDSKECPQYLRHKSYLVSPTLLSQSACRPNTLVQHQGEFVITYPRGYHAGFNLGLNCAESVNFALESWIELGRKADVCRCVGDSVRIDVDALLSEAEVQREEERLGKSEAMTKRKLPDSIGQEPKRKRIKKEPVSLGFIDGVPAIPRPPRIRIPLYPTPCCLCSTNDLEGLLPVNDPPPAGSTAKPFIVKEEGKEVTLWRAHENCARAIPETWVDVIDGKKVVYGVDGIVKDRWALKCADCSKVILKTHGAKIQCTMGKCSKAFHVTCAIQSEEVLYKELEEVEKDIVLMDPDAVPVNFKPPPTDAMPVEHAAAPFEMAAPPPPPGPKIIRTIRKPVIELLCSQHNPIVRERKKAAKQEKIRRDVLALPPDARIRIRNTSGLCEVTLASINEERKSVVVLWTEGERREFQWTSIVWSDVPEGTVVRKVAEEMGPPKNVRPTFAHYQPIQPAGAAPSIYSQPSTSRSNPSSGTSTNTAQRNAPRPSRPALPSGPSGYAPAPYVYPGYLPPAYPGGTPVYPQLQSNAQRYAPPGSFYYYQPPVPVMVTTPYRHPPVPPPTYPMAGGTPQYAPIPGTPWYGYQQPPVPPYYQPPSGSSARLPPIIPAPPSHTTTSFLPGASSATTAAPLRTTSASGAPTLPGIGSLIAGPARPPTFPPPLTNTH